MPSNSKHQILSASCLPIKVRRHGQPYATQYLRDLVCLQEGPIDTEMANRSLGLAGSVLLFCNSFGETYRKQRFW